MADTNPTDNAAAKKTPAKPAKGGTSTAEGPTKAASRKTAATAKAPDAAPSDAAPASTQVIEAKSRFNAALEEAKAGAAALRTEAENRLTAVGGQAKGKSSDLVADARGKAGELAVEGKQVASDAIASLGKVVGDTAPQIEEKLGAQYGDYARKASRTLQETSAKLETKSVEELGEDAREMVRKSPGVAVGVAAVVGFFLARLLGGKRR